MIAVVCNLCVGVVRRLLVDLVIFIHGVGVVLVGEEIDVVSDEIW